FSSRRRHTRSKRDWSSACALPIFFCGSRYNVSDAAENPDAIMVRSANMLDYQFNPELIAIARAGAGVNNIPIDRCSEAGICVFKIGRASCRGRWEVEV